MRTAEISDRFRQYYMEIGFTGLPRASMLHPSVPMAFVMSAGLPQIETSLAGHRVGSSYVLVQTCFRHFDMAKIGQSCIHTSLFEMPGAFVFGRTSKQVVLERMWRLIVSVLGLPADRLWVTYFAGGEVCGIRLRQDEEAFRIWQEIGVPTDRLIGLGTDDNFWKQGGTLGGVRKCGPNTEIFYDRGQSCGANCRPGCSCGRFVEVSNSLFIQSALHSARKEIHPLQTPFTETVVGSERLSMVLQDKKSVFEIDSLWPIVHTIQQFEQAEGLPADEIWESEQVLADHTRALLFLVSDGAPPPGKGGRRRIMRQLVRRSLTHQSVLGIHDPSFLEELLSTVIALNPDWPTLSSARYRLMSYFEEESGRFNQTMMRGKRQLEELLAYRGVSELSYEQILDIEKGMGYPSILAGLELRKRGIPFSRLDYRKALTLWNEQVIQEQSDDLEDMEEEITVDAQTRIITSVPDLRQEIKLRLQEIAGEFDASPVTFHYYDDMREQLIFPIGVGLRQEERFLFGLPSMERASGWIVRRKTPIVAADIGYHDLNGPFSFAEDVRSAVGFPVLGPDEQVLGTLFVNYRTPHEFQKEELAELEERVAEVASFLGQHLTPELKSALREEPSQRRAERRLQEIIERLRSTMPSVDVAVWASRKSVNELTIVAQKGLRRETARFAFLSLDEGYHDLVQAYHDATTDTFSIPADPFHAEEQKVMKWLSVSTFPVRFEGQMMALLCLYSRDRYGLAADQEALAKTFADFMAVVSYNENQIVALNSLHDLALGLTSTDKPLDDLLNDLLRDICTIMGADTVAIYLYDSATDRLAKRRDYGSRSMVEPGEPGRTGGLGSKILTEGSLFVEDIHSSEQAFRELLINRYTQAEGIRSVVGLPLRAAGETIGLLYINYRQAQHFTTDQITLVNILSKYTASAILSAKRLEELRALHGIDQQIAAQLDLKQVLRTILDRALELINFSEGEIALVDKRKGLLEVQEWRGFGDDSQRPPSLRLGEGVTGWVALTGNEQYVPDVEQMEPLPIPGTDQTSTYVSATTTARSELCVPLRFGEEIYGILDIRSDIVDSFTDRHRQLVAALAAQGAIAVHNARHFEQRQKLQGIANEIAMATDQEDLLGKILGPSLDLVGAETGSVCLWNKRRDRLDFAQSVGKGKYDHVEHGEGLIGLAAQRGETVRVGEVKRDEAYKHIYKEHTKTTVSEMDVPMLLGDSLVGVLNFENPFENAFSADAQELAEIIALRTAIALRKLRFIDSLNALTDLGTRLTSQLRPGQKVGEILELIHEQATKLMDTDNMYIALYDAKTDMVSFGLAYIDGVPVPEADRTPGSRSRWAPRTSGKGRTEYIVRSGEPLLIRTCAESNAWYKAPGRKEYIGERFASWIGVPIKVGGRILGVIATYSRNYEYVYDEDARRLLSSMASYAGVAIYSAALDESLRVLDDVGSNLSGSLQVEMSGILRLIRDQAGRLMDVGNMYIALYDAETDTVSFGLAYVDGKEIPEKDRQPGSDSPWKPRSGGSGRTEAIIKTQEPLLIKTREESEAWYTHGDRKEYIKEVFASWVGAPMISGDNVIGVIATYDKTREHLYDERDRQILCLIADHAAVALDKRRLEQLEIANIILREVGASKGVKEFFQSILDLCLNRLKASAGTIRLLDEPGQHLVVWARLGLVHEGSLEKMSKGEGISGRAVRSRRLVYVPDVHKDPDYRPYLEGMRTEMVMPLLMGDVVLGVINVADPAPDAFDAYDRELFEVIANQTAGHILDKIELEKETAKRIAIELDAKMGGLARAIAHHVRSKTGLIRAEAQDLLDDASLTLPMPVQHGLSNVVSTAESIVKLVEDLFRPYERREKEIVPVDRLLGDAVKDVIRYTDIKVVWTPNPNLPMIQVEAVNAVSYFEEIILNAVKAIQRGGKVGKITIESRSADDGPVEILFSNDGPPIPKDLWEAIFKEFVVGPESAKERGVHGLGLWGARVFFERQGGTIRVVRSDEEWTTFIVRLPPALGQREEIVQ